MYSSIRRRIEEQLKTQVLFTDGLCLLFTHFSKILSKVIYWQQCLYIHYIYIKGTKLTGAWLLGPGLGLSRCIRSVWCSVVTLYEAGVPVCVRNQDDGTVKKEPLELFIYLNKLGFVISTLCVCISVWVCVMCVCVCMCVLFYMRECMHACVYV